MTVSSSLLRLHHRHVLVALLLGLLALLQAATCTVYLVPGLHSQHERYGIIAREQPPSGRDGALRKIKSSRVDVVRLPLSKVISQIKKQDDDASRVFDLTQTNNNNNNNKKKKAEEMSVVDNSKLSRNHQCSSLLGPFCFQSFTEGLNIQQYEPTFSQKGVYEVSPESMQLAILSSPGDVLIFLYKGNQPEGLELRKTFVKAGSYLQGQIDILAMDCGGNFRHPSRQSYTSSATATGEQHHQAPATTGSYCAEIETSSQGMLKHFRRLSDNVYTIHSKSVMSKDDISIHASIEFLRSPKMLSGQQSPNAEGEQEEDPRRKHANKRMLVIRNQSSFAITISW